MNLTDQFLQFTQVGAEWVLWTLVALSVISVYVMLDRALFFRSISGADADLRKPLYEALADGRFAEAESLAAKARGIGGRVAAEILRNRDRGKAAMTAALESTRPAEKLRLEHNLSYLGTLGANAPFIGLFGTVLGIIKAFKDLAKSGVGASDNSEVVMAGISEALVATAVGLLVAIPAVVAYNFFQRLVKRNLGTADGLAHMALALALEGADGDGQEQEEEE